MNHAVCVHVDFLGGGDFGQAGHFHHVAAQGDDEACAGGNGDAAHGDAEAFGAAQEFGVVAQGILGFRHADRHFVQAQFFQ